mmetsp:Transcript_29769/g.60432  ORF Transcript_29769/g.60432 Transcript_29769/m.60432 type:complete len:88 (+) Transcript_29769:128-391(+)
MIGRFNLCALLVGFLFLAVACADEQQLRTRDLENIQEVRRNCIYFNKFCSVSLVHVVPMIDTICGVLQGLLSQMPHMRLASTIHLMI